MVKINGVKAANTLELESQKVSALNQILDKMESNFEYINSNTNKKQNFEYQKYSNEKYGNQSFDVDGNQNQNISNNSYSSNTFQGDKSNLIMSVLPALLSKNKGANFLFDEKNILIKELLKNSKNPMINKLFELMPKLANKNISSSQSIETEKAQKKLPAIDSFVKTEDYDIS